MTNDLAMTDDLPTFVTHLECSMTGRRYEADRVQGLSEVGRPLLVRYDLEALGRAIDKETLARRPGGFWRYREFLPVRRAENVVSLGEATTPLVRLPRLEPAGGELLVKDEGRLPTGSFKARGLGLAVAMAKELGLTNLAMPTAGNAGAAMAAYATRAGLKSTIFCPDDAPAITVSEMAIQGGAVYKVNGLINDCGKLQPDRERERSRRLLASPFDPSDSGGVGLRPQSKQHAVEHGAEAPDDTGEFLEQLGSTVRFFVQLQPIGHGLDAVAQSLQHDDKVVEGNAQPLFPNGILGELIGQAQYLFASIRQKIGEQAKHPLRVSARVLESRHQVRSQ